MTDIDWKNVRLRAGELAMVLGISSARVSQMRHEEGAPVGADGLWPLGDTIRWRIAKRGGGAMRDQLVAEQVEKARLQNAKLRMELVPFEEFKQAVLGAVDGLRAETMALPRRWTDDRQIQEQMTDDIRDTLARAGERIASWQPEPVDATDGEDADASPKAKSGAVGRRQKKRKPRQSGAGPVAD